MPGTVTFHTACLFRGAAALLLLVLAGCAALIPERDLPARTNLTRDDELGRCAKLFLTVDRAVAEAGVGDAQSARVPGFPYLRLNRFLAEAAPPPSDRAPFEAWVDQLRFLDRQARQAEIRNLPASAGYPDAQALDQCASVLRTQDLASSATRQHLLEARVPDAYRWPLRALGLYPLTSVPFLLGVRNLHRETRATYAVALDDLPVAGELRRYYPEVSEPPLGQAAVAALLADSASNPLAIPLPGDEEVRRLLSTFAPIWEIDSAHPADTPGRPRVTTSGPARVDGKPVVYTHVSHTYWGGRGLLQLNYVLWFPARPRQGALDLVGGRLDGITWRVTLGTDGAPLLFDAMHNCGCYYLAFPTPRVQPHHQRSGWAELLLIPQRVADGPGRLILRVATRTHYLQRVEREPPGHSRQGQPRKSYELAEYQRLRSLPLEDGNGEVEGRRRSLFGPDGIVPGTQRRERWVFWPMGVPDPGAMRQWGHHAIAFVGRRHFDDARLLERHFIPATSSPPRQRE